MGSDSFGGTPPRRCPAWPIFREPGFLSLLGYTLWKLGAPPPPRGLKSQAGFLQMQAPQDCLSPLEVVTGLSFSFFLFFPTLTQLKQIVGDLLVLIADGMGFSIFLL